MRPLPNAPTPARPTPITGNFSVDLYGPVDTRPGAYGHADYVVWSQPFTNVPAGCRVQITHISGDLISWAMGAVPAGTHAGVLMGAYATNATGSTRASYAAQGYFMYYQHGVGDGGVARIPFNQSVVEGYVGSDNVLCWKVAEFLNTTGFPIHMEITFSQVVFKPKMRGPPALPGDKRSVTLEAVVGGASDAENRLLPDKSPKALARKAQEPQLWE